MIEVDEKEMIAGYQRHADYTRKTMELGERERQAFDVVQQRLSEGLENYAQQAVKARNAIVKLAQLKTDAELAQLAASDPNAYVIEDARRRAIQATLEEIDSDMREAVQQHQERAKGEEAKAFSAAWGVLGQNGINKEKLAGIFGDIAKLYGIEKERFAVVKDPRLVLIMRDAAELHKLREKAKGVRQKVPQGERVSKQVEQRFKTGRARTSDLTSFLMKNPKL
ncbi:hypothetical protein A8M77_14425 [Variovorax sp. JS1663]|nr:hypothetical protein A8M77_14425 [Variovorax sp. JS1663]